MRAASQADGVPVPLPDWFDPLVGALSAVDSGDLGRYSPPAGHQRRSAVLILFADAEPDDSRTPGPRVDVLLTERAHTLRAHPGQVSFPGGRVDAEDAGPVQAALREAREETGLDPSGVEVVGTLPDLYLPVSDYGVTPVLGWWRRPTPVRVVDPGEVASVMRVPVADLVDPKNRIQVRIPSGFVGPAFEVGGLLVWGFTALVLDRVLHLAGWERPWDAERVREITP